MSLAAVEVVPAGADVTATFPAAWSSGVGAQGGVALAVALDAARRVLPQPVPLRAVSAHFLAPVPLDTDVRFLPTLERAGRSAATVVVRALAGDRPLLLATFTFTSPGGAAHDLADERAPDVPGPDYCPIWGGPAPVPFVGLVEVRPTNPVVPLSGSPTGDLVAWMRLREEPHLDTRAALVLADAQAPGIFARLVAPLVIPTVQLTAYLLHDFDADPQQFVLATMGHVVTAGGHSVDRGSLWGTDGRQLAVYQQVRFVLG